MERMKGKLEIGKTNLKLRWFPLNKQSQKYMIECLEHHPTISRLDLEGDDIDDVGARILGEILESNCSLTHLNLNNNNIGDEGAMYLAKALECNPSITELQLYYNLIGLNGAKSLAEMLRKNITLRKLDLGMNTLTLEGIDTIKDALLHSNRSIESINFSGESSFLGLEVEDILTKNTWNNSLKIKTNSQVLLLLLLARHFTPNVIFHASQLHFHLFRRIIYFAGIGVYIPKKIERHKQ